MPTQQQWEGLKIEPVKSVRFRPEQVADGKIALNGDRTTPVFSPYSGRIVKIIAQPSDHVEKSEPLLEIEASEFAQGQNDLIAALTALETARAQAHIAEVKERRQHALYDAKAAAKQDWEQSQIDLESANNTLRSAQVALELVKSKLHILGNSENEVDALEKAKQMNGTAIVQSPISGTVIDRQASVGQFITSVSAGGSTPLYTISDLSTVWLVANVREGDAANVHPGDQVEVHVLAFPDHVFKAKLAYVSPSVDPNTHRITVRAEVDNHEGLLKPEMFASFIIIDGTGEDAPGVPESAVIYEGESAHVWVANADHSITLREIQAGPVQHGLVEVMDGLHAGENIVASGALFIDRAAKSE
jgi:cobalt-zinc-cadmium efflux system membrane fusion protein